MSTSEAKRGGHTPGPWQVGFGFVKNERKDGQKIVRIVAPHPEGGGQDIAECLECNARLIASAPSMLIALKTALRHAREAMLATDRKRFDDGKEGPEWMFIARDAIREAEGGAQ